MGNGGPPESEALLESALTLDTDDLFAEIGQVTRVGGLPETLSGLVLRGQRWFNERREEFCDLITPSRSTIDAIQDELAKARELAVILGAVVPGLLAALAAALIIKLGVDLICAGLQ